MILNYALQLAEMVAGVERQTRMTFEQFEKLPDALELVRGFVEPEALVGLPGLGGVTNYSQRSSEASHPSDRVASTPCSKWKKP